MCIDLYFVCVCTTHRLFCAVSFDNKLDLVIYCWDFPALVLSSGLDLFKFNSQTPEQSWNMLTIKSHLRGADFVELSLCVGMGSGDGGGLWICLILEGKYKKVVKQRWKHVRSPAHTGSHDHSLTFSLT